MTQLPYEIPRRGRQARRLLLLSCFLPLLAATAQAQNPSLPRTCRLEGVPEPARCFTLEVAENPAAPTGRKIPLQVAILQATEGASGEPPLFLLAGGPGQNARSLAPYVFRFFNKGRRTRDIVLVDVRGTGGSNPLDCDDGNLLERSSAMLTPEEIDRCVAKLSQTADLRFYSTYHAMRDIDLVRQALGAEKIALWGGSYGTRAAMVYQKLFPEHTAAVVLDGVAPYEVTLPAHYARDGQRALDLLFARCEADPACRALLPAPEKTLATLLDRFTAEPLLLSLPHPRTGENTRLLLSRELFTSSLRTLLYGAEGAAYLPFLLNQAEKGDYLPLAGAFITTVEQMNQTMYLGFTFSVLCSEDLPFIDRAEAERISRDTFLGTTDLDAWTAVCSRWPRTELPADFAEIPTSQVPALLLSGEIDPVVPPVWGDLALKSFPRGRHLVVPATAHNTSHVGCTSRLIEKFLEEGSCENLDVACLREVQPAPFITSFAGTLP